MHGMAFLTQKNTVVGRSIWQLTSPGWTCSEKCILKRRGEILHWDGRLRLSVSNATGSTEMVGADKARPSLFKSPTSLARTLTTQRCAAMMMLAKYKMKIEIKINIQIQIKTQIQIADFFCSCIYNTSPMMMMASHWCVESTIAMIIMRWLMLPCRQWCNDIKCNNNATNKGSWKMKCNVSQCNAMKCKVTFGTIHQEV